MEIRVDVNDGTDIFVEFPTITGGISAVLEWIDPNSEPLYIHIFISFMTIVISPQCKSTPVTHPIQIFSPPTPALHMPGKAPNPTQSGVRESLCITNSNRINNSPLHLIQISLQHPLSPAPTLPTVPNGIEIPPQARRNGIPIPDPRHAFQIPH